MSAMTKVLTTAAIATVIVFASKNAAHAADPYNYSQWATVVWPNWSGSYANGWVWGGQVLPEEGTAQWIIVGSPTMEATWPSDTSAWIRVRVRCFANANGTGSSELVTGHWVPPDATGPNGGPPEAWVRCPSGKPYARQAQTQVASIYTSGFLYIF